MPSDSGTFSYCVLCEARVEAGDEPGHRGERLGRVCPVILQRNRLLALAEAALEQIDRSGKVLPYTLASMRTEATTVAAAVGPHQWIHERAVGGEHPLAVRVRELEEALAKADAELEQHR